nr:homing endonuclease [Leptographium wingfieldii]
MTKKQGDFSCITLNKHRLVVLKPFIQKRCYSNKPNLENPNFINTPEGEKDKNFYEWLSGLTDSEGSFMLLRRQDGYGFRFQIQLHIDDLEVLHFIQGTLKIGNVYLTESAAKFEASNVKDIQKIIDIFSKFPLNTHKLLNFLDFKKAYELYMSSRLKSQDTLDKVEEIRLNMNSLRVDFTFPSSYTVRITPYWLLGFVEGDGSFFTRKDFALSFNLAQSFKDSILMEAIKDYLNNLASPLNNGAGLEGSAVSLSYKKSSNMLYLVINRLDYISLVLIPFFDGLVWQTKKNLDYEDWKIILELRKLGLHYTDEGIKVLNSILNNMNNNRLTTSGSSISIEERTLLNSKIKNLLEGPSNFEIQEDGRILIKSLNKYYSSKTKIRLELLDENGIILKTFSSAVECSKYLKVSPMAISQRLRNGKSFLFESKLVSLKKSADIPM